MMVEQQPPQKRTSFTQPFYSEVTLTADTGEAAGKLKFDKVFGIAQKAAGPGTKELFGDSKIVPSFRQTETVSVEEKDNAVLPDNNRGFSIKGPLANREIIFSPTPPTVARRIEDEKQDSFGVELKIAALPDGSVFEISLLASSGYPDIDLQAINYVKAFKFLPVSPGAETGKNAAVQTGTLRLDLKSK